MQRTRKWAYVAQEAQRLAALGLTTAEIARRLDVNRSTVFRWVTAGKLPVARGAAAAAAPVPASPPPDLPLEPTAWGASVRAAYALNATDAELVGLAERALTAAQNPAESTSTRLSAMGRFQALVKQLALVPLALETPAPAPVA